MMKKTAKNVIWGLSSQLITLAISIILPRLILISFGSEVNGITSTITQIFVYIALLEAGIGNASINCLYKYIAKNDQNGISSAVSATKKYFAKILPLYALCIVVFAIVYPLCINTEVSYFTLRMIIIIQGLSGIIKFNFTNAYVQLLIADGRNYISTNLDLLVKIISTTAQIVLITIGFDIVSVQLSLLIANIIKAVYVNCYVRKQYPWLKKDSNADIKMLKQRNSFVIHEISGVIFQGTDVFIISVFCSMKEASVYTVYNLVFAAMLGIFLVVFKGIEFNLGAEYHKSRESYIRLHDAYETLYFCFVFAMISAVYIVILPFIKLYTAGVTDANYIIPVLPLLFSLIQLLSSIRMVASKLINISGHAYNTIPNTLIGAVINIVASVVLVNIFGMPGVLLGTIVALLYRTNDIIIYANKKILKRTSIKTYKKIGINMLLFAAIVFTVSKITLPIGNYFNFVIVGAISLLFAFVLYFGVNLIISKELRFLFFNLSNKILKKSKV